MTSQVIATANKPTSTGEKVCANQDCGKTFTPNPQDRAKRQRFCSAKCRWEAWNREHPRVEFVQSRQL